MAEPVLLTIDEAAAVLRCGRRKVFALLAQGVLTRGPCYGAKTVVLAESVYDACNATPMPAPEKPRRVRKSQRRATFEAEIDAL